MGPSIPITILTVVSTYKVLINNYSYRKYSYRNNAYIILSNQWNSHTHSHLSIKHVT